MIKDCQSDDSAYLSDITDDRTETLQFRSTYLISELKDNMENNLNYLRKYKSNKRKADSLESSATIDSSIVIVLP
jgi:hypothetical protein